MPSSSIPSFVSQILVCSPIEMYSATGHHLRHQYYSVADLLPNATDVGVSASVYYSNTPPRCQRTGYVVEFVACNLDTDVLFQIQVNNNVD